MNYKLYQIDLEKDTERYAFMGQEFLDELGCAFRRRESFIPLPMRATVLTLTRRNYFICSM